MAQPNGRIRFWGVVIRCLPRRQPRSSRWKALEVVTIESEVIIRNAFFDRDFYESIAIQMSYNQETDNLYIELKPQLGADTREVAPCLNVDLDGKGEVVGSKSTWPPGSSI